MDENPLNNLQADQLEFETRRAINEDGSQRPARINKTQRKYERYVRKLEKYKLKKLEKKKNKKKSSGNEEEEEVTKSDEKKEDDGEYLNKRELKMLVQKRLGAVYNDVNIKCESLKICVDCSFSKLMSSKEMSRLAQQIGRCYALNKLFARPVHFTLCNLQKDSPFYAELCRVNDGFERYILERVEQSIDEYKATSDELVYLSPDSDEYLEEVDANHVYVIGGLVDETVSKKVTLTKCNELQIKSYALPIEKYLQRQSVAPLAKSFTYNKILTINQVFEILATYFVDKDWPNALARSVPKRKGFVLI